MGQLRVIVLAALALGFASAALAQAYPAKRSRSSYLSARQHHGHHDRLIGPR